MVFLPGEWSSLLRVNFSTFTLGQQLLSLIKNSQIHNDPDPEYAPLAVQCQTHKKARSHAGLEVFDCFYVQAVARR